MRPNTKRKSAPAFSTARGGCSTATDSPQFRSTKLWPAPARAILDAYLSRVHLDDMEGSCPVIGLATDVARSGGPAKRAYRQVMEMMASIFAANLGSSPMAASEGNVAPDAARQRALAVVALCVGGMVL